MGHSMKSLTASAECHAERRILLTGLSCPSRLSKLLATSLKRVTN